MTTAIGLFTDQTFYTVHTGVTNGVQNEQTSDSADVHTDPLYEVIKACSR